RRKMAQKGRGRHRSPPGRGPAAFGSSPAFAACHDATGIMAFALRAKPTPALRYGSGRSSLEKPDRWLFVRCADRSSPLRLGFHAGVGLLAALLAVLACAGLGHGRAAAGRRVVAEVARRLLAGDD